MGAKPRAGAQPATPEPPLPDLDDRSRPVEEVWDDFFSKHKPSAPTIRKALGQMHDKGRHDHVIAFIQAAMIHGQARPWMYEVLALSMEIDKRPRAEIERVLLSRIDFTAADVPSMIYSAAYLVRFGGDRQALRMYRQASVLDPTRPEPYALGLKLAKKLKDHEAIRWAAAGTLTNVWSEGYGDLHRQAENAAADSRKELIQAERMSEVESLDLALAEARKHDLVVKLTWTGEGDLDLIVEEPQGTVCSFDINRTRGGGILVHDGYGPAPGNCYEEYRCPFGFPGDYRVKIHHAGGNIVGKRATLTVTQYLGAADETTRSFTVTLDEQDKTIRVPLPRGRRTREGAESRRTARVAPRPTRSFFVQQAGGAGNPRLDPGGIYRRRDFRGRIVPAGAEDVGYQPIITVINEGITQQALAVVSGDRRYVRISTVPVFQSLADVFTFSFVGGAPSNGGQGQAGGGNAGQP